MLLENSRLRVVINLHLNGILFLHFRIIFNNLNNELFLFFFILNSTKICPI